MMFAYQDFCDIFGDEYEFKRKEKSKKKSTTNLQGHD